MWGWGIANALRDFEGSNKWGSLLSNTIRGMEGSNLSRERDILRSHRPRNLRGTSFLGKRGSPIRTR